MNNWDKNINKAIKLLKNSGLWDNILKELIKAKTIGYIRLKKAEDEYYNDNIFNKEFREKYKEKYPDLTIIEQGKKRIHHELFYWVNIKIKKMYFGKEQNKNNLNKIKEALKQKKSIKIYGSTSKYDVSFTYNNNLNEAWYNEEYKGMGNGHYYLALNDKYALFYEDD